MESQKIYIKMHILLFYADFHAFIFEIGVLLTMPNPALLSVRHLLAS